MSANDSSWLGEFHYDDSGEQSLHGLISYSSAKGIVLRFLKPLTSSWSPPRFLRGILESGEECALIGPVDLPGIEPIQYSSHYDGPTVVSGEIGYQFLVLGKHAGLEELVGEISFSFSGLASFAAGSERYRQFKDDPIVYSSQTQLGILLIWRADSGAFTMSLMDDYYALGSQRTAFESLATEFDAKARGQNIHLFKRTNTEYRVILKLNAPEPLGKVYASVQMLISLFSFLLYSPLQEDSVTVSHGPGLNRSLRIFKSSSLDEKTLAIINSFQPLQDMPVTINDLVFDRVLEKWLQESPKYMTLLSGIQARTGIKAIHEIYSDLVMCCSFMDTIASEANLRRKCKYEDVIQNYACRGLQEKILAAFGLTGISESGKAICELRGDIVHFKGESKWLDKIPREMLCDLVQCLELTVIGYLFDRLGIGKEVSERYQMFYSATDWLSI